MSSLDELKKWTTVVSDTGEINLIKQYHPQDGTTNPSLIYKASCHPEYKSLIEKAVQKARGKSKSLDEQVDDAMTYAFVYFGAEILKHVPGRVSTEVDARYSFDMMRSYAKAKEFIALYEAEGIDRSRVLIKLASTWEGICVAKKLEEEGIHCNMTLMFSLVQAVAAAEAGATLISPFVGRIYDWYKKNDPKADLSPANDPGVVSVRTIYHYYKHFGYKTEVMGASFRNMGQITELAGCDLLTIAPSLLEELQKSQNSVPCKLDARGSKEEKLQPIQADHTHFLWGLNTDPMASQKLYEGIFLFDQDAKKLRELIRSMF